MDEMSSDKIQKNLVATYSSVKKLGIEPPKVVSDIFYSANIAKKLSKADNFECFLLYWENVSESVKIVIIIEQILSAKNEEIAIIEAENGIIRLYDAFNKIGFTLSTYLNLMLDDTRKEISLSNCINKLRLHKEYRNHEFVSLLNDIRKSPAFVKLQRVRHQLSHKILPTFSDKDGILMKLYKKEVKETRINIKATSGKELLKVLLKGLILYIILLDLVAEIFEKN